MENTQICEQIIKDFNGKKIPGEMLLDAVHAVYFLFISHHHSLQHTVSSKPWWLQRTSVKNELISWQKGCLILFLQVVLNH